MHLLKPVLGTAWISHNLLRDLRRDGISKEEHHLIIEREVERKGYLVFDVFDFLHDGRHGWTWTWARCGIKLQIEQNN